MNKYKKFAKCFYDALVNMINHDGIEHAGYMAFLSMLSFFPFLVIFVAFAGVIGESELGHEFVKLILHSLPSDVSRTLDIRIKEILNGPPQGLLTLSILGAIWTASSSVEGLRTILNRVYKVSTPPAYILRRLLSIGQFLVITILVIIAMMGLVFFPIVWVKLSENLKFIADFDFIVYHPSWVYLRYGVIALVLLVSTASLYTILPNIKLSFKAVIPGAAMVVGLWILSGWVLSLYIRNFNQVNLIYGSLGGVIVSLLFFFILNMILIYGAEFNYLLKINFLDKRVRKKKEDK